MRCHSRRYKTKALPLLLPGFCLGRTAQGTEQSSCLTHAKWSLYPFVQENISTIWFCKVPGWHNRHKHQSSFPTLAVSQWKSLLVIPERISVSPTDTFTLCHDYHFHTGTELQGPVPPETTAFILQGLPLQSVKPAKI